MGRVSKKTNAIRLLEAQGWPYELVEYHYDPGNLDVAKIADDNHLSLPRIFKTLVAKGDKTGPLVAVVPGNASLNYKKLARASQNKKITLVPVKELQALTGYVRGGCSPIGMKRDYPVFLDVAVQDHSLVYINAGQRGTLVGLSPQHLIDATSALVVDLSDFNH